MLAIAAGGALGSPARYAVSRIVAVPHDGFPWATFWTNVSGALALAFFVTLVVERFAPARLLRAFVGVGFLGAYTTYSTLTVETVVLVKDGHTGIALAYSAASLVFGILAAFVGVTAGRVLEPRSRSC